MPCTWDKPRRASHSAEIKNMKVHIRNNRAHEVVPHHKVFIPCKTLDANANREIEKKIIWHVHYIGCSFTADVRSSI